MTEEASNDLTSNAVASNGAASNVVRRGIRSDPEAYKAYQRDLMRRKRAEARTQGRASQTAQDAPGQANAASPTEPSQPSTKPRPGGHKLKRPVTPTPVAEKPVIDPSRSSTYTEEIAAEICERLSNGETLNRICTDAHLPSKPTVIRWTSERPDFGDRYARARDRQIEAWADEVLDKADAASTDNGAVNRDRLAVDARKWLLSKLKPEKYGDRLDARLANPDGSPLRPVDVGAAVEALLAALPALPAPEPIDVEAVPVPTSDSSSASPQAGTEPVQAEDEADPYAEEGDGDLRYIPTSERRTR